MHSREQQIRRAGGAAKIVIIVLVAFVLVCGGALTYVVRSWKGWVAGAIRETLVEEIKKSNLPEGQKDRLGHALTQLANGFEEGRVSKEQFGRIMQKLGEGPFLTLILVEGLESRHMELIQPAEADRPEIELTFERFERGIYEGKITETQVQDALSPVATAKDQGMLQIKEDLTADELKAAVENMERAANEAAIPVEPYQVDFASELETILTDVLGSEFLGPTPGGDGEGPGTTPPADADDPPTTQPAIPAGS